MIVGQASASIYLENFIILLDAPTLDSFKMLIFYQFWALLAPLVAGPSYVLFSHMWTATAIDLDVGGTPVSLTYGTVLGLVGFGNVEQLFDIFMGMMPKVAINYMVSFSLLSEEASYGTSEVALIENL